MIQQSQIFHTYTLRQNTPTHKARTHQPEQNAQAKKKIDSYTHTLSKTLRLNQKYDHNRNQIICRQLRHTKLLRLTFLPQVLVYTKPNVNQQLMPALQNG